jgi:N-hydroxyarylamine O-acetyltransferase
VADLSTIADAYLRRLGLEAEPPSAEALIRLHRAQVERVPYETLWIHLGERWGPGPTESFERTARTGRGGYCFHLNGAFGHLLLTLGYDVVRHVGGVHGPEGPSEDEMTNHLVLTVHDLPTEANPGGIWYVDVGLGDALHDPLPLVAGSYESGPFHLRLEEAPGGPGDWHLAHDPKGGFTGMTWRSAAADPDAFDARHLWLSTSPESGFVKVLTVQRRDATGADVLQGLRFRRIGDRPTDVTLAGSEELVDLLRTVFGLDVDALHGEALGALWARVHAAHVAWETAGRP